MIENTLIHKIINESINEILMEDKSCFYDDGKYYDYGDLDNYAFILYKGKLIYDMYVLHEDMLAKYLLTTVGADIQDFCDDDYDDIINWNKIYALYPFIRKELDILFDTENYPFGRLFYFEDGRNVIAMNVIPPKDKLLNIYNLLKKHNLIQTIIENVFINDDKNKRIIPIISVFEN